MVEYKILYSKLAQKDAKKLSSANLDKKAKELIEIKKGVSHHFKTFLVFCLSFYSKKC